MRLLVTGGAGYIGSHAAHQLADRPEGHHVVVLDNLYSGHRWAIPDKAVFVEGDVADTELVGRLLETEKIEAVLHFAAHTEVAESVENPSKYYRNNTANSLGLFEACLRHGVGKIIFSSTAAVYGEPLSSEGLKEDAQLKPINPYGASKSMTERILKDLSAASAGRLRHVILRYFNVAGARRDLHLGQATPRATQLIRVVAETALGLRESLQINGSDYATPDGTCGRDYIHIEDLVQAHLDALTYLERGGPSEVLNVGYGHTSSVLEVIAAMERVTGREIRALKGPRRVGDPSLVFADIQKIRHVLGWRPRFDDLDLICRTAFEWEKAMLEKRKKSK